MAYKKFLTIEDAVEMRKNMITCKGKRMKDCNNTTFLLIWRDKNLTMLCSKCGEEVSLIKKEKEA